MVHVVYNGGVICAYLIIDGIVCVTHSAMLVQFPCQPSPTEHHPMNLDDLLDVADNPDFIPGIYNYCDRWCERCGFTDRCLQYVKDRDRPLPIDEDGELDSEALMEQLGEILQASADLLRKMAAEEGIDLDAIDTDEIEAARERLDAAVDAHPLSVAADSYARLAYGWFEAAGPDFQAKGEQWETFLRLNIPGIDVVDQALELKDAVEVIQWYEFFVPVQVASALHIRLDPDPYDAAATAARADSTAKIALIAMDRSLAAWTLLLRALPQRETETLEILSLLDRLRRDFEEFFPDARAFVRPGFDTPEIGTRMNTDEHG